MLLILFIFLPFPIFVLQVMGDPLVNFVQRTMNRRTEDLAVEYSRINRLPVPQRSPEFVRNMVVNRFWDIVCLEGTRVRLDDGRYIHANWVHFDYMANRRLIATQSPMANTVDDFWHMLVQERVQAIVMLCGLEELGSKCHQYWPDQRTRILRTPSASVRFAGEEHLARGLYKTHLEVQAPNGVQFRVRHFHVRNWPDHGVPSDVHSLISLISSLDKYPRVVVHCSAGVGRTGTLIALLLARLKLKSGRELDVAQLVLELRERRAQSVQSAEQFLVLYSALLSYSLLKAPEHRQIAQNWGVIRRKINSLDHRIRLG